MTSMLQEALPRVDAAALADGLADSLAGGLTGGMTGSLTAGLAGPPGAGRSRSPAQVPPAWSPAPWLRLILDAIDYGAGVMLPDGSLVYANAALQARLRDGGPLRLDSAGRLRAACPQDEARLVEGRLAACARGLRRLVPLGRQQGTLALIGVAGAAPTAEQPCLLLAQRTAPCERLSLSMFARQHALTPTEAQVLQGLSDGQSPEEIGSQMGVRITTVRTHIVHLRAKTGAGSLRELMRCMATLPPVVSALRQGPALGL